MKIVSINTFNIGSTGKIMLQIADEARKSGIDYYTCCPRARDNYKKQVEHQIFIGNRVLRNVHGVLSRLTGLEGLFSIISTVNFLKGIDAIKPDVIHLHNIHGSYINYPLLFCYIKKRNIRAVWTLHDCWAFTGRCPYFMVVKCNKWKSGCNNCLYPKSEYPTAKLDSSYYCYKYKKNAFCNVENLIIVTPSNWLAGIVKQSFLGGYPVKVINNGIDLEVFRPCTSNFKTDYGIKEQQKIILGVAFNWDYRKGLDVFSKIANILDDNFKIVLVGTNEDTEKYIPKNVITIRRTENQKQLAEIYSAADVLVNPTREDNYPTVNMEAIACGTPVITFHTGGSPEIIDDGCGEVVDVDDIDGLINAIEKMTSDDRSLIRDRCAYKAKRFDWNENMQNYIKLYEDQNQVNLS